MLHAVKTKNYERWKQKNFQGFTSSTFWERYCVCKWERTYTAFFLSPAFKIYNLKGMVDVFQKRATSFAKPYSKQTITSLFGFFVYISIIYTLLNLTDTWCTVGATLVQDKTLIEAISPYDALGLLSYFFISLK